MSIEDFLSSSPPDPRLEDDIRAEDEAFALIEELDRVARLVEGPGGPRGARKEKHG